LALQPAETQPNGLFCPVKWAESTITGLNQFGLLVVGQFEKLTHYQYQRLAIRLRIAGLQADVIAPAMSLSAKPYHYRSAQLIVLARWH
jgi:hypothetical protein